MKQVVIKGGKIDVEDSIVPNILKDTVLVKVSYSCISTGTELSSVASRSNLLKTALERPDLVKLLIKKFKDSGLKSTMDLVKSKISIPTPLGYSCAGIVIESNIPEFKEGDRVAVAGAGIANHADFVVAPKNLVTKIPDKVSLKDASYTTVSSIALQGVRRIDPKIGDTYIVFGLGLLGQITCQLLRANGCKVIGYDINKDVVDLAKKQGFNSTTKDLKNYVFDKTNGIMADGVIITAATKAKGLLDSTFSCVRRKGKVVVVGDVLFDFKREELYKKELDLLISTSYGPGRYDTNYELKGQDYPVSYVRWTENRNMSAVLDLVASNQLDYSVFNTKVFKINDAKKAYDELKNKKIMVGVLEYEKEAQIITKKISTDVEAIKDKIKVGVIGPGSFVSSVHLPNLKSISAYQIYAICANEGLVAKSIAATYNARYYSTDYHKLINDKNIDLIFIGTRHDTHGKIVLESLKAGKHVFVEKPLCINKSELVEIENYLQKHKNQILMIGHNRRYAPLAEKIKQEFFDIKKMMYYRVNAGYISMDHWVQDGKQGTRILGEMVHFIDFFNYFSESDPVSVNVSSLENTGYEINKTDNLIATIEYENGDVATLLYTAMGSKEMDKERFEVFGAGKSAILDDYKRVTIYSNTKTNFSSKQDKGHYNELVTLGEAIRGKTKIDIEINQGISATKIAFEIIDKLRNNKN